MKTLSLNQSGYALVSVAIGGLVGMLALALLGRTIIISWQTGKAMNATLLANTYAAELLEFVISQNTNLFKSYLSKNPVNPKLPPYVLCTPINLFDPATGKIVFRDTLADLPNTILKNANRYYRVEIINIANPDNVTSRRDLCGKSPADVMLSVNERFLITVGISWSDTSNKTQQTALSGIISGSISTVTP